MSSLLVETKVRIPRLRHDLISRSNLIERLKAGLYYPLMLVSAPAGYGKTTLLTELAQDIPIAWFSLDNEDNEPARFWSHFLHALHIKYSNIGELGLRTLTLSELPLIRPLLVELINEITEKVPDEHPCILVLDDYHLIEEGDIHKDLTFFIEHMPVQFHLIISTRADPPIPLAKMRARDQLSEFRAYDLRFTGDEIDAFLSSTMGLHLSQEDIAAIETHTEGWIASLQLAAISMRQYGDVSNFITAFAGTHRYILDYLSEEVLKLQTSDTRSFLLKTSILNRLCGPLCDAITGQKDGQETLEKLESENVFLIPLDNERKWYRYHHLFSSLLYDHLRSSLSSNKEHLHSLNRKAAIWFRQNSFVEEAISHALLSEDYEMTAQLIESVAGESFMRMEFRALMTWLKKLPDEIFTLHPRLCAYYAHALSRVGEIDAAEVWLKKIEGILLPPIAETLSIVVSALTATAHRDDRQAMKLLSNLLENNKDYGNVNKESTAFRIFVRKLYAAYLLSQLQETQGCLGLAADTCQHALESASDILLEPPWSAIAGWLHLRLAKIMYEKDELEDALQHTMVGNDIGCQSGNKGLQAYGAVVLALVRQAKDGYRSGTSSGITADIVTEADRMVPEGYSPFTSVILPLQIRLWFAQGNFKVISKYVHTYRQTFDLNKQRAAVLIFPQETIDMSLAYADLSDGKPDEAEAILEKIQQRSEKAGRIENLIECYLLQALVLQMKGNVPVAISLINKAIVLARPESFIRLFIDLGSPMKTLLKEITSEGVTSEFISRLLIEFEKRPSVRVPVYQLLAESLTLRELDVLRLIANDLSNKEIAQKLVLTVGTVKTHAHNIYAKFGVRNRSQAVKKAIKLNLL